MAKYGKKPNLIRRKKETYLTYEKPKRMARHQHHLAHLIPWARTHGSNHYHWNDVAIMEDEKQW